MVDKHAIGHRFRRLRVLRSMTQEKLAEASGLSPDTVRRIEQGQFSPSVVTLSKLCNGLGVEVGDLLKTTPEPHVQHGVALHEVRRQLAEVTRYIDRAVEFREAKEKR